MLGRKTDIVAQQIEKAKIKLLDEMDVYGADSQEFKTALDQLERLTKLPSKERKSLDVNTIVTTAGKLLGVLVIVAYEQKHAFTSKGLNYMD